VSPLDALVLGVIQGLTEFLPVSSSGHLVLAQALLGLRLNGVAFDVVLHVATLSAVLWVYRERVLALAGGVLRGRAESWRYFGLLLLASVPAGLVGYFGEDFFERVFSRPVAAAAFLLVTGIVVWSIRFALPRAERETPRAGDAWWVGVAQAVSILPGISRSGSTVAAGVWLGVDGIRMAEFSFLMSVPAIAGAAVLQMGDFGPAAAQVGVPAMVIGFVTALGAGVLAIRIFLRMLRARSFHYFGYYCWIVGGGYLIAALLVPGLRG